MCRWRVLYSNSSELNMITSFFFDFLHLYICKYTDYLRVIISTQHSWHDGMPSSLAPRQYTHTHSHVLSDGLCMIFRRKFNSSWAELNRIQSIHFECMCIIYYGVYGQKRPIETDSERELPYKISIHTYRSVGRLVGSVLSFGRSVLDPMVCVRAAYVLTVNRKKSVQETETNEKKKKKKKKRKRKNDDSEHKKYVQHFIWIEFDAVGVLVKNVCHIHVRWCFPASTFCLSV